MNNGLSSIISLDSKYLYKGQIDYVETGGLAILNLQWAYNLNSYAVIPSSSLYYPTLVVYKTNITIFCLDGFVSNFTQTKPA